MSARGAGSARRAPAARVASLLAFALALVGALGVAAPSAQAAPHCGTAHGSSRSGRLLGLVHPHVRPRGCAMAATAEPPYNPGATPPLLNHGGPVMSTPNVGGQVVVTPIFWAPSGYSFTDSYKSIVDSYISNVAADSGAATNIFATLPQYTGRNGTIANKIVAGTPLADTTPFPTSGGCTPDSGAIYADRSGYTACIDDAQLTAETGNVLTANRLPSDLGHIYLVFLPRGVESCEGPDGSASQACTLNWTPTSAYCAYHSSFGPGGSSIYGAMPFPVYASPTGGSCGSDGTPLGQQSPNGDIAADTVVSSLSHEVAEAITDPEGDAWYDSSGNENGDDCAYVYGPTQGSTPGALWNQTINGAHYLTQEEFSNADYVAGSAGCVQGLRPAPTVTAVAPNRGSQSGGQQVTVTGTDFTASSSVHFGSAPATSVTVLSPTQLTAVAPALAPGAVDVTVTTLSGTSPVGAADAYTSTADTSLTLASSAPSVPYGTSTTLTATLSSATPNPPQSSAGQTVDLLATTPSGTTTAATAQTDSTGAATFTVTPTTGTSYRASFAGTNALSPSTSPAVNVAVTRGTTTTMTAPATASYRQATTITGSLHWSDTTAAPGAGLELWFAPRGGAWARVATATTGSTGSASFTVSPTQSGTFQVRYAGGLIGGVTAAASSSASTATTVYRSVSAGVSANASTIAYGRSVTVTGTLAWAGTSTRLSGQAVELWAYALARWSRVATGVTSTTGTVSWTLRPAYISTYQLRYAGNQAVTGTVTRAATSSGSVVRVAVGVALWVPTSTRYWTTIRVTGRITPVRAGVAVSVFIDGTYRVRVLTDGYGYYSFLARFPRGTHTVRTWASGTVANVGASSATYRIVSS